MQCGAVDPVTASSLATAPAYFRRIGDVWPGAAGTASVMVGSAARNGDRQALWNGSRAASADLGVDEVTLAGLGPVWVDTCHRLLAQGLTLILQEAGISTQFEAPGATICLCDYSDSPGRTLSRPRLPTLALVRQGTAEPELFDLIRLGHRGYITSGCDAGTLLRGVAAVCRGELWVESDVLMRYLAPRHSGLVLTTREREVLYYLRRGWTNLQIAGQLAIAPKTVKTHVSAVLNKHGVRHRTELMVGSI